MKSGIYALTFKSGHYYIGRSVDIWLRYAQHCEAMEKGTAARMMQLCYNDHGFPEVGIIVLAHPDHLDVLEAISINQSIERNGIGSILNDKIPEMPEDYQTYLDNIEMFKLSTAQIIKRLQ